MDARSSIAAGEFDTEVDSGQEVGVAAPTLQINYLVMLHYALHVHTIVADWCSGSDL